MSSFTKRPPQSTLVMVMYFKILPNINIIIRAQLAVNIAFVSGPNVGTQCSGPLAKY